MLGDLVRHPRCAGDLRPAAARAHARTSPSAIIGTVGPATAELVKDSDGRIKPGDDVGISGLQKRYDEQLSGTRGATIVAVDEEGERRTLFTAEPVAGQATAHDDRPRDPADGPAGPGRRSAPASALVAIRPSTGELVAAASGPGSKGYNTATYGRYAPGSTFKVVSSLALLRAGVEPGSQVPCPATTVVDGKSFKNYDDYPASGLGRITFEDAARQLVQHGVHLPARQARTAVARAGRGRARVSGSTTTSASRRTSVRWVRPAARPRPPPA